MVAVVCLIAVSGLAQGAPDKAYLQKIWDGWSTMQVENVDPYYAAGAHVFFDDEPLKFNSWSEYRKTAAKEAEEYKSWKFTLNDDVEIHAAGANYWGMATLNSVTVNKDGKEEKSTLRWTFVLEKQKGRWVLVHEHVSAPVG
jgi:ketosteroid isomerase-like protein